MESFLGNLMHFALWSFFIIFALALVGVIAIIKWIVDAVRKTESVVEGGVRDVEGAIRRR